MDWRQFFENGFVRWQQAIENAFTSPDFYMQVALAAGALLIAFLTGSILRGRSDRLERAGIPLSYRRQFALAAVPPLVAVALLFGADILITAKLKSSHHFTNVALVFSLAWLGIRLSAFVIRNSALQTVVGYLISAVAMLVVFRLWTPLLHYLDALHFEVADFRISLLLVLKGLLLLVLLMWITGALSRWIEHRLRHTTTLNYSTRELIIKFSNITLYVIAFIILLNTIGVDLTALAVFGGALGVGIGFGLQKIAANLISGIILLAEKSIKAGDLVEVDNVSGWVRNLAIRHTLIETFDGREILIPNEDMVAKRVTNWTYTNTRARVEIKVGVSYGSDPDQVRDILLAAARNHPRCMKEPEPAAFLLEFGESSLNFSLYLWVADVKEGRFGVIHDVLTDILRRLHKAGITIPFPQRDVHMVTPEKEKRK